MGPTFRNLSIALVLSLGLGACAGPEAPATPTQSNGPTAGGPATAVPGATGGVGAGDSGTGGDQEVATATRIAVAGDPGTGGDQEYATATRIAAEAGGSPYDALVLLGDLIYPSGDPARLDTVLTKPFAPVLDAGTPLVPVLGNHDYRDGQQDEILDLLGRSSSWYEQRIGDVRIIVLDTERVDDPAQTRWLDDTLAEQQDAGVWTVVAMHKPAYSAGQHGSSLDVRAAWSPLFEQYGVPLVLAGHDHDYQRSTAQQGVVYVVSGAAANLRPAGREPFTAVSTSTRHFLELVADDHELVVRAVDQQGAVLDTVTLSR